MSSARESAVGRAAEQSRHVRGFLTPRRALILLLFFFAALAPRLYGGLWFGVDMDGPGTFRIVNYDEGGSCRAILGGRPYSTFTGRQILALASALGHAPPAEAFLPNGWRSYCHSRPLIMLQRVYAAVAGALTVVLLGLLALMMWPEESRLAWTSCALLAFSNLHVAQSHWGTADAPQVFFVMLFTVVLAYGLVSGRRWPTLLSPLFLVAAIWTKWYVFAALAYAALLVRHTLSRRVLWALAGVGGALAVVVLATSANELIEVFHRRSYLLWGSETSTFGSGYGHIGTWRRWIRNGLNLPLVHLVGIGIPACLFAWNGIVHALRERENRALWLLQAPACAYALYMLVLGPVTYYRHYLPLFPTVVLLCSLGLWRSAWASRRWFLVFFFAYPLLLTLDSEWDYRFDTRRDLRPWFASIPDVPVLTSYYVVPPPRTGRVDPFRMQHYIELGPAYLRSAAYVILSENWYDTAFANELNGPLVRRPEWLIKTRPEDAVAFRRILAGRDPNLELVAEFDLFHATPEMWLHHRFYGTFQLFVGDLKIYAVRHGGAP